MTMASNARTSSDVRAAVTAPADAPSESKPAPLTLAFGRKAAVVCKRVCLGLIAYAFADYAKRRLHA